MRSPTTTWSIVFGLVLLAFVGTVVALNSTLYSAHGFVEGYLQSLARHDASGALALPGVEVPDAAADDLLTRDALGELGDIRLISDETGDSGTRRVTFAVELGGHEETAAFLVESAGTTLGLFQAWRFAASPVTVAQVTVAHDDRFRVNGFEASVPEADTPTAFAVFAPGDYRLDHDSEWLTADPVDLAVTGAGEASATVEVRANADFVEQVQTELDDYLDDTCVTQEVLQPTGCPFGQTFGDRVVSTPQWSMAEYPEVAIVPGADPGTWLMPRTDAAAHLVVDVQSLFDGTVTTFDEDVPFTVSYLVTFQADGSLYILAQYE